MSRRTVMDVSILGDRALTRIFQGLERKHGAKVLRPALRKGAVPIRDAARVNAAPGLTGRNAANIRIRSSSRKGKLSVQVVTGRRPELGIAGDAKYYYPSAVELGTDKMPARPFLRPALESNRQNALAIVKAETWRRVELLGLGRDPGGEEA